MEKGCVILWKSGSMDKLLIMDSDGTFKSIAFWLITKISNITKSYLFLSFCYNLSNNNHQLNPSNFLMYNFPTVLVNCLLTKLYIMTCIMYSDMIFLSYRPALRLHTVQIHHSMRRALDNKYNNTGCKRFHNKECLFKKLYLL